MAKGKAGICKLCHKEKPLARSHIIPETFYNPVYEDQQTDHSYSTHSTDPNDKTLKRQKGIWELMLCQDECEVRLSAWEKYTSEFFRNREAELVVPPGHKFKVLRGVDYPKLKLFHMSVLWRAGISTRKEFAEVSIGTKHEERLREMLINGHAGEPYEYGCAIIAPDNEIPKTIVRDSIQVLGSVRFRTHHMHRFLFAGFYWFMYVSSNMRDLLGSAPLALHPDGRLLLCAGGQASVQFLLDLYQDLKGSGKI